ncbi:MAG: ABC transporter ATP-binding protein [Anaerolineaceae bacterium]|nr:ABC transporter ATP-binding protein [Anaerolineaceae bacterium]
MSDIVIRVENLGKKYYIGTAAQQNQTLAGAAINNLKNTYHRFKDKEHALVGGAGIQELWALKDISFELKQGEVLGIIGDNGSGKSTLLKLLSRISAPTTGNIIINGRVGSLLEVGAGFHPDLTGRENVYLNGAILGIKENEIRQKFDEIIDFSGIEKFIDTPVKRYSSGMYVRLAFSVAIILEPEIFILDEVLAVGDNAFQKKCVNKMEQTAKSGKTVLFVSHSMPSVTRICNKGIYLENGMIKFIGSAVDTVSSYLKNVQKIDEQKLIDELSDKQKELPSYINLDKVDIRAPWSTGKVVFNWISTHKNNGQPSSEFVTGESLIIRMGHSLENPVLAYGQINIMDYAGGRVMQLNVTHNSSPLQLIGDGFVEITIPEKQLQRIMERNLPSTNI